jgi:predicted acyl esterase
VNAQSILRNVCIVALFSCGLALGAHADEKVAALPSDTPEKFTPTNADFDYVKREEMVAMRDGVKLKTFILIPKGAKNAPILLNRTPYDAGNRVLRFNSPHLIAAVPQMDDTAVQAGYIIVFQDVRGKYGSEGDYVMTRALHGPANPTDVDHATDCYDTIDWLV